MEEKFISNFWSVLDSVAKERQYLLMVEAPPIASTEQFIKNIIEKDYPQFIAMVDESVIGWCDIIPNIREGAKHVGNLGMGILPAFRGKGIGKKLIETTICDAWKKGLLRIELEVFASNVRAIALYEKVGFILEGKKRKGKHLDGIWDDNLIMGLLK